MIFLENTREFPEISTSTGAEFWLRFCLSVLILVILKSPIDFPQFSASAADRQQDWKTKI